MHADDCGYEVPGRPRVDGEGFPINKRRSYLDMNTAPQGMTDGRSRGGVELQGGAQ
jgi:hypothetical protein